MFITYYVVGIEASLSILKTIVPGEISYFFSRLLNGSLLNPPVTAPADPSTQVTSLVLLIRDRFVN